MKKLILALLVVLMLGGGAVGVMYYMKIGPFAEAGSPDSTVATEEIIGPDGEKKTVVSKDQPVFYPLDPLVVPIFDEEKVVATIQIQVKLEVMGKENREKVSRLRPRIADALLRDLYGFLPRLIQSRNHVDVSILKRRMQMITDRTIGEGVVQNVLVQSISDQPN